MLKIDLPAHQEKIAMNTRKLVSLGFHSFFGIPCARMILDGILREN